MIFAAVFYPQFVAQFEPHIVQSLLYFVGCTCIRIKAYHTATHEMIERAIVRPPSDKIQLTPPIAVEDPTNLLYRLLQFARTTSTFPPKTTVSTSDLDKDLATALVFYDVIESTGVGTVYYGPFRGTSRRAKTL
ncbi:unnamed protein product [Dibothriocephalus latus]|uniref:Uncharacterized protein n=1 Tax=Dibothriocephalus latus TaxID=60516 RepID=A0A3P7NBB0_DIBLA|nr:unnamed protein product [Dibothriocephalus latus]